MARKGKFGRLPAAAPDLAATIVSLYEQYESQRDRNIMDAWQNGGEFEGSKVTDQRMLGWFQMRMDQVGKDDPNWDYWHDQLQQTTFHIAEQKANLEYTRTSDKNPVGSNQQMADFYREWAQKLPRASAAWRDLMTSAARFAKAARAAASAGAASSRAAEEKARLDNIYKNAVKPGYTTLDAIYNVARDAGWTAGNSGNFNFDFTATEAADFTKAGNFDEMLAAAQISRPQLMSELRAAGVKGWDGVLNGKHIIGMLDNSIAGWHRYAKVAQSYGNDSAAKTARDNANGLLQTRIRLKTVFSDLPDKYLALRTNFMEAAKNAHDPVEAASIYQHYANSLNSLANEYGGLGDLSSAGALRNEANAARGGEVTGDPTYFENAAGTSQGTSQGTSTDPKQVNTDAQALMLGAQHTLADATNLSSGASVMQVVPDSSSPTGERVVIMPKDNMQALGQGNQVTTIELPTAGGSFTDDTGKVHTFPAGTITQAASLVPVMVTLPQAALTNPDAQVGPNLSTGAPLGTTNGESRVVGYRVDLGHGEIMWATNAGPNGELVYSSVPPFVTSSTPGAMKLSTDAQVQSDGVFKVEYSLPFLSQMQSQGAIGSILQSIPAVDSKGKQVPVLDPTTGKQAINADGTPQFKIVGYTFDPNLLRQGASPFLPPDSTAQPTPAAGSTAPTTPDTAQGTYQGGGRPQDAAPGGHPGNQHPDTPWEWQGPVNELPPGATKIENGHYVYGPAPQGAVDYAGSLIAKGTLGQAAGLLGSVGGALGDLFKPQSTEQLPPGMHTREEYQQMLDKGLITPGGAPGPNNVGTSSGYVVPFTPEQVAANDAAAKATAVDGLASTYYGTLATHPEYLSWALPTLARAASSPDRRAEWARQDPALLWQKMVTVTPDLATDPALASLVAQEMDVLRGAGKSGIDEQRFAYQRAVTNGENAFIAEMHFLGGAMKAYTMPTVASMAADRSPGSPFAIAEGIHAPGTPNPLTPTTNNQPIMPSIKTPDSSISQQLIEQHAMQAGQYGGPTPTTVAPTPTGVGSSPSTALPTIAPLPTPKPTTINPAPAPVKQPKPPQVKVPQPPTPTPTGGGTGGRGGKIAL